MDSSTRLTLHTSLDGEVASISSSDGCFTPVQAAVTESAMMLFNKHVEHHPREGKTLVIRTHDERKLVLELAASRLQVTSEEEAGLGVAWTCVKTKNWYGFVNTVSGTHLGHDGEGRFRASVHHHLDWEWFAVDRHRDGGYVIMVSDHGGEGWLLQMAIGEDGRGLVAVAEGGTAWDFVEMDSVEVACHLRK